MTPTGVRPAALYGWGIVARKMGGVATNLIAQAMDAKIHAGLPI